MTTLRGVDVSSHQGAVDFAAVAASGRSFVWIKATESDDYVNPFLAASWAAAAAAGLVRGAYLYAQPAKATPAWHVGFFEETIAAAGGLQTGDLVALDLEEGAGDLLVWAAETLDLLERACGVRPVLYSGHWFASAHNLEGHAPSLGRYPLWWASYQPEPPPAPDGWERIAFWQFTTGGTVPGVVGPCDEDVFVGTRDELVALGRPLQPLVWSPPFHVDPPPVPTAPAWDIRIELSQLDAAAERWEAAGYPVMGQGIRALAGLRRGEK